MLLISCSCLWRDPWKATRFKSRSVGAGCRSVEFPFTDLFSRSSQVSLYPYFAPVESLFGADDSRMAGIVHIRVLYSTMHSLLLQPTVVRAFYHDGTVKLPQGMWETSLKTLALIYSSAGGYALYKGRGRRPDSPRTTGAGSKKMGFGRSSPSS